jgi:hypothetical protein
MAVVGSKQDIDFDPESSSQPIKYIDGRVHDPALDA